MKNYLLIIFALLIVGCGNQPNTEEWPIKPTNEIAARLIELDSISRAILGDTSKTQDEVAQLLEGDDFDAKAMQQMRDSANLVWHTLFDYVMIKNLKMPLTFINTQIILLTLR